jgi:hypothetical protein
MRRARLRERYTSADLNERQRTMLQRLVDGFEGKLISRKCAAIAKC